MPAKPLTNEQKLDAERLNILFKKNKIGTGITQSELADKLGFSVQSAVSQYLNGKIPLNIEAAIKFADSLRCSVSDFSPSLQKEIDRISKFASSPAPNAANDLHEIIQEKSDILKSDILKILSSESILSIILGYLKKSGDPDMIALARSIGSMLEKDVGKKSAARADTEGGNGFC